MLKRRATKSEALRPGGASRKNIPTAEFRPVMARSEQSPVRVAYERRNHDLDPQLVWRGKDAQNASDLVVQAPPLYIQERVHPKVLVDDLRRQQGTALERDRANEGMRMGYTAVVKQSGEWWIGWIEEIPGVNCQERTHEELRRSLAVALAEALEFRHGEINDVLARKICRDLGVDAIGRSR